MSAKDPEQRRIPNYLSRTTALITLTHSLRQLGMRNSSGFTSVRTHSVHNSSPPLLAEHLRCPRLKKRAQSSVTTTTYCDFRCTSLLS